MSYDKNSINGIECGVKVRFTGKDGRVGENIEANKKLQVNEIYTVREVTVYDWHTDVYLEGFEVSAEPLHIKTKEIIGFDNRN